MLKILQQQSVVKKVKFEWFYHRKYEMKPLKVDSLGVAWDLLDFLNILFYN